MSDILTVTSVAFGKVDVGQKITQMQIRHLSRWERFVMWNNKFWKWPPRWIQEEHVFEIKSTINGTQFEVETI